MNEIIIASGMQVPTKAEITAKVNEIVNEVSEGNASALRTYGQLSAIKKACEDAMKEVLESAIAEREKYGKDNRIFGVRIDIVEGGVKYDYSADKEWSDLQEQIKALQLEQKARETILKGAGRYAKSSKTTLKIIH